ncbi:trypsin domain-containing protein [Phthorimaea operculella]|nr:trypsin domain-containing protein [Phthorimaea operculella]
MILSSLQPALKLAALYLCFTQNCDQCQTPSGETGKCIPLKECAPLMAIIKKPARTQTEIEMLRKSQCGQEKYPPKVCCPAISNTCFTPDAQEGKCVRASSCPHFASLMKDSNEDVKAFVQASKCGAADSDSVCCGNKPPELKPRFRSCPSTVAPPWPKSGCCGIDSSAGDRIIGGKDTGIEQYPWTALIEYTQRGQLKLLCGGALISGKYVLTAAHCLVGKVLRYGTPRNVRLGEYDSSNDPKERDCVEVAGGGKDCTEGVDVIPIEDSVVHEQTLEQCQPAYNVSKRMVTLWHGQICAGGEPGKDSCKGDSGGPLMYENLVSMRTFEIVGITNFGHIECGTEGTPGVYLKVYEYLPWIRKNIKP